MGIKKSKKANMVRMAELHDKIDACVNTIYECEDELMKLRTMDSYDSGFNTRETLWLDLRRVQSGRGSYGHSLGKYGEDPCFAIAALLEQQLPTLQSGLRMQGCSILVQDRCGRFCMTGCVDGSIAEKICVYGQPALPGSDK